MEVNEIETAAEAAAKKLAAAPIAALDAYEMDLISFLMGHKGVAIQFALIVAVPVGILCYTVGKYLAH